MEKTFIEKRIEERANQRLREEYDKMFDQVNNSPFLSGLKVGEERLKWGSDAGILPDTLSSATRSEKSNLPELIEARRAQLIKEETDLVMRKLDGIEYLFRQV